MEALTAMQVKVIDDCPGEVKKLLESIPKAKSVTDVTGANLLKSLGGVGSRQSLRDHHCLTVRAVQLFWSRKWNKGG